MKKLHLFVMFIVLINFFALAQTTGESPHSFFLGVSTGLLAGKGEEIVYYKAYDELRSQLLWDINPLFYAGAELGYMWFNHADRWGLFADASVKFGFPGNTGIMEDRDWLGDDITGTYNPNWLTHYSVSSNRTEFAMLIDARIGIAYTVLDNFLFKTHTGYSFMHFSWAASGGSGLFPWNNGHYYFPDRWPDFTNIITYKQTWHMVSSLGLSLESNFNRYFSIEPFVHISLLAWGFGKDEHLLRDLVIEDKYFWGAFFEPGFIFSLNTKGPWAWSLRFSYRLIAETFGDKVATGEEILQEYGAMTKTFENSAGGGYSAFDIGLVLKYKFLPRRRNNN